MRRMIWGIVVRINPEDTFALDMVQMIIWNYAIHNQPTPAYVSHNLVRVNIDILLTQSKNLKDSTSTHRMFWYTGQLGCKLVWSVWKFIKYSNDYKYQEWQVYMWSYTH